jgi:hypothetical protein
LNFQKSTQSILNCIFTIFSFNKLKITENKSIRMVMLMHYDDLIHLLIGAEGAKTPAGVAVTGDPAGVSDEEAPGTPAESEAPGVEINRQFIKANKKRP